MFNVTLAITHPTNVAAAYDPTQLPAGLMAKALQYRDISLKSGMNTSKMILESQTKWLITYEWESREKRDAFYEAQGAEYVTFFDQWSAYVSSRGCKLVRAEESHDDVL